MTTPGINSAEFFGLEPGTPEAEAFERNTRPAAPDVTGVDPLDYVDYKPDVSRSLQGVSYIDQRTIKDLIDNGWDTEQP